MDELTPEEEARKQRAEMLAAVASTAEWGEFRTFLQEELANSFEAFLDGEGSDLTMHQGAARALVKVLQEVDCASSRSEQISRVVQARYEAALDRERADLLAAEPGLRGRRTPAPI